MARTPKKKVNEPETEKVEVIEKETKVVEVEETKITTPEVVDEPEMLDGPCELREVLEMALELVEAGKFSAANRAKQGPSFQRRLIAQLSQIIKQV